MDRLRLVDHHVHGVVLDPLSRHGFEQLINEGGGAPPPGASHADSPLGVAIRRWCAPALELDPHSDLDLYLERRAELGEAASRRLLESAGLAAVYVDTGHRSGEVCTPQQLGTLAAAQAREVVRVEAVFEQVAAEGGGSAGLLDRFAATLAQRCRSAVGLKSIVAYRHGFDLDPAPPRPEEVRRALDGWLAVSGDGGRRLDDPVLLRAALWVAAELGRDLGLPLQLHAGFGDTDLDLHRADPVVFTPWLRAWQAWELPVVFLHCYPYHRQAGYLAAVWRNAYFDLGAALNYAGARAPGLLAEALEIAPFTKLLYSSDAFGLAELVHLGALQHRRAMDAVLGGWVDSGEMTLADAARVAELVARGNAARIYDQETDEGG